MTIEYAMYKGEELQGIGTIKELAKIRGVKPETIKFYATNVYKSRRKNSKRGNYTSVVKLEDDEE